MVLWRELAGNVVGEKSIVGELSVVSGGSGVS